jgi:hypothetical protein
MHWTDVVLLDRVAILTVFVERCTAGCVSGGICGAGGEHGRGQDDGENGARPPAATMI